MPNTFYGDANNNYIVSANGEDIIYGLDGVDELHGRGGTDQLFGGNGEDTLFGEDGTDTLDGGADNDQLDGGYGNDTLTGGTGDDLFIVNDDTDTITDLGLGNDDLSVGPGAIANASVLAAWAATGLTTNDGTVNITTAGFAVDLGLAGGGNGFTVTSTGAATTLTGSAQDDTLNAGTNGDTLIGGGGNDRLVSSARFATAVYSGIEADYTITRTSVSTWEIVDINLEDGDTGTDTLVNVPTVQFADGTVLLPVNRAPVVSAGIANQTINEDAALNFQIPVDAFSDPNGDVLSLTATLANDSPLPDWLSFDAATGTFSGTPPLNFNGQLAVKVVANDGEFSVSDNFTLTVRPVNDAPVITSGGGGATAAYTVLENTRAVARITASDPDAGATQRYAIVGGKDASLFSINAATGDLVFKSAPNFEKPMDANGDGIYSVVVRVSDGLVSDRQTLQITVADVVDELISGSSTDNSIIGASGNDQLFGLGGNDILNGSLGNDLLSGGNGLDWLIGGYGNDQLSGDGGSDSLLGGSGNDLLNGGSGADVLTGGSGRDRFVFDLAPNLSGNVDIITDFSHAQGDKLLLSKADFTGFTQTGALTAGQFLAAAGATTAQDAEDRIIYDTSTGALYYDVDGAGGESAIQFATIQNHATAGLAYNDFAIIV